ncbi:hypothetical protein L1049_020795 [Liquidambar formosana]|uniref:Uncharacterized protein n=1 Tax=Liquidambar formosana TaxID=63359 RepID=A0AAP0S8I9_LIQFO
MKNGRKGEQLDISDGRTRESTPNFFSDVFDPFSPTRSLSQVLNMIDQFMENQFWQRLEE